MKSACKNAKAKKTDSQKKESVFFIQFFAPSMRARPLVWMRAFFGAAV